VLRNAVDSLLITPLQVLDNYTQLNAYGLHVAGEMIIVNYEKDTKDLNLRFQIANLMEWLGIFRGTFASTIFQSNYDLYIESELFYRVIEINTKVQIYKNQFLWYADDQAQLYSSIMNDPPVQLAQTIVSQMKQGAFNSFNNTSFKVDNLIDNWFGNMTIVIDAVNQVFVELNSNIEKEFSSSTVTKYTLLIGLLIELVVATQLIWMASPIVVFYFRGECSRMFKRS